MQTNFLDDFIQPVPSCTLMTSLETVLNTLGWGAHEAVVVVDDDQRPTGIVSFRRLMATLFQGNPVSLPTRQSLQPALNQTLIDYQQQPHEFESPSPVEPDQVGLDVNSILIERLGTVPLDSTICQLRLHLQTRPSQPWAVVDSDGKYLGLLDQLRLWPFLAAQSEMEGLVSHTVATEPVADLDSSGDLPPSPATIAPLIQVLDRLPLPLMLQTSTGQVLSQNLAWQQQLGELQDPYNIRQEAASVLEAIAEPVSHSSANVCRLGIDNNTCVCVCPMKNGQERIWQFIKIPLGAIFPEATLARIRAASRSESRDLRDAATSHFHLASLESTLDEDGILGSEPIISTTRSDALWLVLAQDTTEQQQVSKELAAKNADLVQLNRLKDEFLACISHELKTPLTAILGLSSLLQDQVLGPLNERQSRYARLIHQGGRHLILIVNDILDLTRIETGQLELNLDLLNIETVCQRAYEQAKQLQPPSEPPAAPSTTEETPIQFKLEIQAGLVHIVADELRLRQMLTNLLSNAIKFTGLGGEIGLRVNVWEGWIAFTVWDTGIGIPADKQHLIFQKFQQLENPLTRQFEGTGLGLVLTQRLARLHGGDVTFTSAEGQGSEFTLLLPPCPPQTRTLAGSHWDVTKPSVMTPSKRLVLVVEAVPRFLENLTSQLTGLGYRVAIARSGTEALEKVRRLQPAVVFLNPLLPLLSGWDVLTLLKSDDETSHIPIVVTGSQVEKTQAYSNAADGFLSLPVQTDALQRSLDHLANRVLADAPEEKQPTLTVLHLHTNSASSLLSSSKEAQSAADPASVAGAIADLNTFLYPNHCRVLQVDDLDQADLLGRVWKPDLVLLDGHIADPLTYLKQLGQYPFLASLPLVTLTPEMTQAANQITGLIVFPCLAAMKPAAHSELLQPDAITLWQVMQVAAGTNWTSHLLIVDLATLKDDWDMESTTGRIRPAA
ncbi:MAG TPA: ATP-binding protein, partial [Crinalium sp.]